jgi:Protein of unknown function (DUF3300)
MKRTITLCLLSCLVANVTLAARAATRRGSTSYIPSAMAPEGGLSAEQMDNLLAPIALYPDPLLAQVFPASTFVDQIDQAARWLRSNNNNPAKIDSQNWDVSVKSVGHYPQVIYMMSDKLDWTTALGQAYVNQSTDVLTSVQRLRARAKAAGYLVTTPQQTVIVEKEVIKVVPAQPQVIYVPTYNPQVVFVQPSGPSTGTVVAAAAISFGVGLAIGAWLNNDCNWYSHTVYYHGWHGSGWVSTSSHYVHVNSVYVNNRYRTRKFMPGASVEMRSMPQSPAGLMRWPNMTISTEEIGTRTRYRNTQQSCSVLRVKKMGCTGKLSVMKNRVPWAPSWRVR